MYKFVIGTIFKNEAHILKEWLDHYLDRDVEHIYMINDKSTDDYLSILQPYISHKKVTLYHTESNNGLNRQDYYYNLFFSKHLQETKWFGIFDLDEFLYSPNTKRLLQVIENFKDFDQIHIKWVHYGSSNHIKQPSNVVSSFLYRGNYDSKMNGPNGRYNSHKSIIKTSANTIFHIHSHRDSSKHIRNKMIEYNDNELLINHYAIQSFEFWTTIKMTRGDVNKYYDSQGWKRNIELFCSMNNNNVYDNRLFMQNNDDSFKTIMSIGMRCFTEIYLKQMNLKKFSGPFDGTFMITMEALMYILKNGITNEELDHTENHKRLTLFNKQWGFRTNHNKFLDSANDEVFYHRAMFPHHNLNDPGVFQHFQRCFKRLEFIEKEKIKTLFVLCSHPEYSVYNRKDVKPSVDEIKTLSLYLSQRFNSHLLYIFFEKNNKYQHCKQWHFEEHNECYSIVNVNNNSTDFLMQKTSIYQILSFFNINNSLEYNDFINV